ncbi:hypothetical protein GCM10010428_52390 [Actinosynnema pretiosum subsp. pretiosum]
MQALPDPCLDPFEHSAAVGRTGAEAELGGQVGPPDAGVQYEQDALQALAGGQPFAAGVAEVPGRDRDQWLDQVPQLVTDNPWRSHILPGFPPAKTPTNSFRKEV